MFPHRLIACACLLAATLPGAAAQNEEGRKQLQEWKKTLQALDWHGVDFSKLPQLERCRAMLLLNHALDEIGAAALAEADLMGTYLEDHKLAEEFAASKPQDAPRALTWEDCTRIAAALLKGPMADSPYAKELSTVPADKLDAYEKLYENSARDKWEKMGATTIELRQMATFLRARKQMKAYMEWSPAETQRRQELSEDEMAKRRAEFQEQNEKREAEQKERTVELEKQRKERADSQRAQQALVAAQQQTQSQPPAQPPNQPTVVVGGDDDDWYPGWYYGVIDSRHYVQPVYRNNNYQDQARARVQARASARGGGGGRR